MCREITCEEAAYIETVVNALTAAEMSARDGYGVKILQFALLPPPSAWFANANRSSTSGLHVVHARYVSTEVGM